MMLKTFSKTFLFVVILSLIFSVPVLGNKGGGKGGGGGSSNDYTIYRTGASNDIQTNSTQFGLILMGGGGDVPAAEQWMIDRAGGGDLVVIRTSGSDGYNDYLYNKGGLNSVTTIVFHNRNASSNNTVVNMVKNADALLIAGGNQATYVDYWKGTPIEAAINNDLLQKGVPILGTSAGLAIMSEFVYTASSGTVYSHEALADPYNRYMTLDRNFLALPHLNSVITDSHFKERDRMGRLVGFLARNIADGWTNQARGIGIDEATAVVVSANGTGQVMGSGGAYFLRTTEAPIQVESRKALRINNVEAYKLTNGQTFNFSTWSSNQGIYYSLSASNGSLTSSNGKIYGQ